MAKIQTPDSPLPETDPSQLPSPTIDMPDLDGILKGGQLPPDIMAMMGGGAGGPPPGGAPAPQGPGPQMPPPGMGMPGGIPPEMANSPQAKILEKMGGQTGPGQTPDTEGRAINLITSSIKTLNQLSDVLMGSDEANAKTIRQIIRILGDILKNAQHGGTEPVSPEPGQSSPATA